MASLRYRAVSGTERSYFVWFKPSTETVWTDSEAQAVIGAAKDMCWRTYANAIDPDGSFMSHKPAQNLVGLVECLHAAIGRQSRDRKVNPRGLLCLPIMDPHNVSVSIAGSTVTAFTISLLDEAYGDLRHLGAAGCWILLAAPAL